MGREKQYFSEYMKPRDFNGMGDLFEFGLLPRLEGLYRRDYAKHMGFGASADIPPIIGFQSSSPLPPCLVP